MKSFFSTLWLVACLSTVALGEGPWKPAAGPLATRWAKDVAPERVWQEYPRPQLVRDGWQNLNGLWQYAIRSTTAPSVVGSEATVRSGKR